MFLRKLMLMANSARMSFLTRRARIFKRRVNLIPQIGFRTGHRLEGFAWTGTVVTPATPLALSV